MLFYEKIPGFLDLDLDLDGYVEKMPTSGLTSTGRIWESTYLKNKIKGKVEVFPFRGL